MAAEKWAPNGPSVTAHRRDAAHRLAECKIRHHYGSRSGQVGITATHGLRLHAHATFDTLTPKCRQSRQQRQPNANCIEALTSSFTIADSVNRQNKGVQHRRPRWLVSFVRAWLW